MGEYSYGEPKVRFFAGDHCNVHIGRFCSIGPDVEFMVGGNHRVDWVSTYPLRVRHDLPGALADGHPSSKGDIRVGNDVWIGSGARILSGVSIGDGAVIASFAVVARNVRPYALAAGNPAHEISRRFDDDTIERLLRVAWWNWELPVVLRHVDQLNSTSVGAFLDVAESNAGTAK
jgi:acetyltransferase-like isoleucine patch superfamily enzyme